MNRTASGSGAVGGGFRWGVDIGGTTIVIGTISDDGFRHTDTLETDPEQTPDDILIRVKDSIIERDPSPEAVGVGIAGLVDAREGVLISSPNLTRWRDYRLKDRLQELLGCPVMVDNDCNVFAIGALGRGLIPKEGLWLMVTLGTGIGGTIVNQGRVVYGSGFAGEFGHMTVKADGESCPCGSRGCWERYAAAGALSRYAMKYGAGSGLSPMEIGTMAEKGIKPALMAFEEFGTWLGIGLQNLWHCFSPGGVFLAGGLMGACDHFLSHAEAEFRRRCQYPWRVTVLPGSAQAGAMGAAMMTAMNGVRGLSGRQST